MALRLTTDGVSVALNVYVPREVGSWTDVTSAINQPHSLKAAYPSPGSYVPPVRRADEIGIEWGWLMVKPIQRYEGTFWQQARPPRAGTQHPLTTGVVNVFSR